MYLTWITSPGEKDEESRKLGTVYSGKFAHSRRFAPLPCTVYLVIPRTNVNQLLKKIFIVMNSLFGSQIIM